MGIKITQFPARDRVSDTAEPADPVTYEADDVTNEPEKTDDLPASVTYTADDVDNQPAKNDTTHEPVTTTTDWPTKAAPSSAEAKVVTEADTKSPAPRKAATKKRGS